MLAICHPDWNPVPGTCPRRGGMLAIYGPQEVGARHLSKTPLDASTLRPGLEISARHLPKVRRDASNLRAGLEIGARHLSKTPLDASNLRAGLEIGARHLSKDAAGC